MKKLSLKIKLVIMNIIILFIMSIILTVNANFAADRLVSAAQTTPAIMVGSGVLEESQGINAAKSDFKSETIYSMIVIIVIGSVMTFYLSSRVLKPLSKLSEEVSNRDINNLSEKLKVEETGDEVESLAKAFNEMTEKIHQSYVRQKNFSVNVAHELRTPLAVLQSKIDVFERKENRTLVEYDNLIKIVGKNTERLSILVKDLLELTNESDVDLNQSVYVKELIEECIFELEDFSKNNNILINVKGEEVKIKGNNNLLQRVFYNLIENAIKYNVKDGKVDISIDKAEENLIIAIADSGLGIPDNFKNDIFEPFARADKSRNREIGGNGLGLAIVKHIINKHGGTIEVKDNSLRGSIFRVKLKV